MRSAAQLKGGFYPAPPEAVSLIAKRLTMPAKGQVKILDPCAGEGAAIIQIANELGADVERDVYAIELDAGRSAKLRTTALHDNKILAPASFFGTSVGVRSFSFIWCNPPFDNEIGGGYREESRFLDRSLRLLQTGGVIAMVCPEKVAASYAMRQTLMTWFDNVNVVKFPESDRKYNEVVVLGVKRAKAEAYYNRNASDVFKTEQLSYAIPSSQGPGQTFRKIELTDDELADELSRSPLNYYLDPPDEEALPSPPLELGMGHLALLLSSGQLDGLVHPEGEEPHVVRGTARKEEYVKSSENTVDKSGSVNNKTVIAQKIVLTVRALDHLGKIHTFTKDPNPNSKPPEPPAKKKRNGRKRRSETARRRRYANAY